MKKKKNSLFLFLSLFVAIRFHRLRYFLSQNQIHWEKWIRGSEWQKTFSSNIHATHHQFDLISYKKRYKKWYDTTRYAFGTSARIKLNAVNWARRVSVELPSQKLFVFFFFLIRSLYLIILKSIWFHLMAVGSHVSGLVGDDCAPCEKHTAMLDRYCCCY